MRVLLRTEALRAVCRRKNRMNTRMICLFGERRAMWLSVGLLIRYERLGHQMQIARRRHLHVMRAIDAIVYYRGRGCGLIENKQSPKQGGLHL